MISPHTTRAVCLLLAACAWFGCGEDERPTGPSPPALYAVFGHVASETGAPLSGVTLRVADGAYAGKGATSDASGGYRIDGVAGGLTVLCSREGYEATALPATVTSGDVRVDFRLRRSWVALSGRATDAVDGSPIPGVLVRYGPEAETTSAADGSYSLPPPPANAVLTLSRAGYWTRQTNVRADSEQAASTELLPDGKGFDLAFFDYVFRRQFGGTARWVEHPVVEVWAQEFACEVQNHGMPLCTRIRATDLPAPASFIDNVREVVARDLGEYTGGVVQAPLEVRTHAPGTIVTTGDLQSGVITFAYVKSGLLWPEGSGVTYGTRSITGTVEGRIMVNGHVQIHDADKRDRSVVSHELAHALGYFHPGGYDAVPLPSCMKSRIWDRPTEVDKLHGRILYRRPPGNRTPDSDPSGAFANLAAGPVEMHVIR